MKDKLEALLDEAQALEEKYFDEWQALKPDSLARQKYLAAHFLAYDLEFALCEFVNLTQLLEEDGA